MCRWRLAVRQRWARQISTRERPREHHSQSGGTLRQSCGHSIASSSQRATVKDRTSSSKLLASGQARVTTFFPFSDCTFVARTCWRMPSTALCRPTRRICSVGDSQCCGTQRRVLTMADLRVNSSSCSRGKSSRRTTRSSSTRPSTRTPCRSRRSRRLLTIVTTGE